jgi:pimeloyl-ACP methyl ester carboxylesterase
MRSSEITIPLKDARLGGELIVSEEAEGLVLFAHGSGSSRHSPRNQFVARTLRQAGLGTLLFDLMTAEEEAAEERTRHLRFNIAFLSQRLSAATLWAKNELAALNPRMGYFGSSTGAAAALVAAAELGNVVSAIVSRGGRPDLAQGSLELVSAPTLLIVGGEDTEVITLNQEAYDRMRCEKDLRIIPGASHLFEEPGKLEEVAEMASDWFVEHLHPVHKEVES